MKRFSYSLVWHCLLSLCLLTGLVACRGTDGSRTEQQATDVNQQKLPRHRHHHHRLSEEGRTEQVRPSVEAAIPDYVRTVLAYVRENNRAPDGYVGGRTFGNFERQLPTQTTTGQRIRYQEWDVKPKIRGQNRGAERLITGSDDHAYYTHDHYRTFTEIE